MSYLAGPVQTLFEDEAHLLKSRSVIRLEGAAAWRALQPLLSRSLERIDERPALAYMLSQTGEVQADLFIVAHDDGLMLDCESAQAGHLLDALAPTCRTFGVSPADVTSEWRVFGILPSQSVVRCSSVVISYADPRMHMGTRAMRRRSDPESSLWGHETKWIGHCFKLGLLPDAGLARAHDLNIVQANLDVLDVLDVNHMGKEAYALLKRDGAAAAHRVMPLRVEPTEAIFPTLTGLAVSGGGTEVGTVLAHLGVCGLALVDIAAWRRMIVDGEPLRCAGQMVSMAWPTWLASRSRGRAGPVARVRQGLAK